MPFFRFPFFYNPSYYNRFSNYNYVSRLHNQPNSHSSLNNGNLDKSSKDGDNKNHIKNSFENSYLINKNINNKDSKSNNVFNDSINSRNQTENNTEDNYFFEIFGLKLFFDDILLICLIFFLYQEGVKDNELFLSLILLLLS